MSNAINARGRAMPDAFKQMLDLMREFQAKQLERNRAFIEHLPPAVKARIPDDAMTLLEHGYAFAYADAIRFCRELVEAEKEKEARHGNA